MFGYRCAGVQALAQHQKENIVTLFRYNPMVSLHFRTIVQWVVATGSHV